METSHLWRARPKSGIVHRNGATINITMESSDDIFITRERWGDTRRSPASGMRDFSWILYQRAGSHYNTPTSIVKMVEMWTRSPRRSNLRNYIRGWVNDIKTGEPVVDDEVIWDRVMGEHSLFLICNNHHYHRGKSRGNRRCATATLDYPPMVSGDQCNSRFLRDHHTCDRFVTDQSYFPLLRFYCFETYSRIFDWYNIRAM